MDLQYCMDPKEYNIESAKPLNITCIITSQEYIQDIAIYVIIILMISYYDFFHLGTATLKLTLQSSVLCQETNNEVQK